MSSSYITSTTKFGSHWVKDIKKLEPGDHIYVYMTGIKSGFRHHGIVYQVPGDIITEDDAYDRIQICQLNSKKKIHLVNLQKFSYNRKRQPRYVVYGVSWLYWKVALPGTCHTSKSISRDAIVQRCTVLLNELSDHAVKNNELLQYDLLRTNCEDMALWCTLGGVGTLVGPQVQLVLNSALHVAKKTCNYQFIHHLHHVLKYHHTAKELARQAYDGAKHLVNSIAHHGGTVATNTVSQTAATVTAEGVKTALNVSGAGAVVGVSVGVEAVMTTGRIIRYQNDITYTKEDLKLDVAKGSTTAVVVGCVGGAVVLCSTNPIGWAILAGTAAGLSAALVCWGCWRVFDCCFGKSRKAKLYIEFSFTKEFKKKEDFENINKLKKLRSDIKQLIREHKLHPNSWSPQDREDMKNRQEWLDNSFWNRFKDNFSGCFSPIKWYNYTRKEVIDKKIKSYKTKSQKLKVYFLLFSILDDLNKDIQRLGNNDDQDDKSYGYREPLAITWESPN